MMFLPAVLAVLFLLLHAIPQRQLLFSDVVPSFTCMTIYYWCLFRPSLMPYWFLFLLGLLQDILLGLPLGASPLVFILFRISVISLQRLFGKETFWGIWVWFSILTAFASLGVFSIMGLIQHEWIPLNSAVIQWVLTVACYPLVHGLFTRIYKRLPKDRPVSL
jgi:rod shape-determining protein MreD